MIYVFGAILQSIHLQANPQTGPRHVDFTSYYHNSVGGKGALQALAAAKAGAKVGLVGKTGDDELSKHITLRLRKHGVITSGIARDETIQTGTEIFFKNEDRTIIALGASEKTEAEQLPIDILNDSSALVLQTELPKEENIKILRAAKEAGAKTFVNMSPHADLSVEDYTYIDYLIITDRHREVLDKAKGIKTLCTVILHDDGAVECHPHGATAIKLPKIEIENINFTHHEGAEDAFCGTFAASIHAGLALEESLKRAQVSALLTATRRGAYDAIPYIDDVNTVLKALNETKRIENN